MDARILIPGATKETAHEQQQEKHFAKQRLGHAAGLSAAAQKDLRENIPEFQHKAMNQYRIAGIHFIDKIPVTSIGKPKRYLLREYVLSGAETAAAAEEKMKEEPAPAEDSPAPSRNAGRGTLNPAEVEKEIFRIVKNISKYERELTAEIREKIMEAHPDGTKRS